MSRTLIKSQGISFKIGRLLRFYKSPFRVVYFYPSQGYKTKHLGLGFYWRTNELYQEAVADSME